MCGRVSLIFRLYFKKSNCTILILHQFFDKYYVFPPYWSLIVIKSWNYLHQSSSKTVQALHVLNRRKKIDIFPTKAIFIYTTISFEILNENLLTMLSDCNSIHVTLRVKTLALMAIFAPNHHRKTWPLDYSRWRWMFLLVKCASVTDSAEEHKQTVLVSALKVLFKL